MKRNIRAFWLEASLRGQVRAIVLRDKRGDGLGVYSYLPTPSSLKRIRTAVKNCCVGAFPTYTCEPYWAADVLVGWVLNRIPNAVYPPPEDNHVVWYVKPQKLGTQNGSRQSPLVPNKATKS